MSKLQVIVVTPEMTLRDEPADFVVLPLYDGEIGIAPGHSPLIGRLGFGELRIKTDARTERFYVDGGFVQVADNIVSVMTSRAVPAEKINPQIAAENLEAIRSRPAHGSEEIAIRQRQEAQARAQLRVARHASAR
jgi:F-type H+-transporting ATPase subunit epsilon